MPFVPFSSGQRASAFKGAWIRFGNDSAHFKNTSDGEEMIPYDPQFLEYCRVFGDFSAIYLAVGRQAFDPFTFWI